MFNREERIREIYSSFRLVKANEKPDPTIHTSYWCKVENKSRGGVKHYNIMPRVKAILRGEKIVS